MNKKLRIGIAMDTFRAPAWKHCLLEKLVANDFAVFFPILFSDGSQEKQPTGFKLWKSHMALDKAHFKPRPDAFEQVDTQAIFKSSQNNDLKLLKKLSLDLIFWDSDVPVSPEVYEQLSTGVLYFTHGEDGKVNEDFLGYSEFNKMAEVLTSALVLRTSAENPAREIYRTWSMMPTLSMSRSRNEHMWKLSSLVSRALHKIHAEGKDDFLANLSAKKTQDLLPGFVKPASPSSLLMLRNFLCHFTKMGLKALRKIAFKEQWILLLNNKQGTSTSFGNFKKILPPKDRFWADPFLVEKNKKQYLFIEELPFATEKGHLSVMEIDGQGALSKAVTILDKPYHLSYPFIFEIEGTHYMIPESYEDKNIQLYKCIDFPYRWEYQMNLMSNLDAFDTTLYFYHKKWWLFTLISEQEGSGHNDELFLFFADTPFTSAWKAHPQNPIVSDVRLARPAGNIYEQDGKLIRPSQDCAKKYGYGFNLNEIEILTETDYREKRILNVRPDWDKSLKRTHSFNHLPGITVIDAVVQRFRFF